MAQKTLSRRLFKSAWDWCWDWVIEHWGAVASVMGGGVMTYLASLSDWLTKFGPVAWGAVGIIFALLIGLGISGARLLLAQSREKTVRTARDAEILARGSLVNPLAHTFSDARIFVNDLVLPSYPVVSEKRFTNCDIIGPASIYLASGTTAIPLRAPLISAICLRPDVNAFLLSSQIVAFERCQFVNCSFQRITLIVDASRFNEYRNNPWLSWMGYPPPEPPQLNPALQQPGPNAPQPQE